MYRTEKLVYLEALVSKLQADDEEFTSYQEAYYRVQAGIAGELKIQRTLVDYHFIGPYKFFLKEVMCHLRNILFYFFRVKFYFKILRFI